MAIYSLPIPTAGLTSPESWGSRKNIIDMMKNIEAKYGKFFKFASETSRIPKIMLMAFCAVESGGNPKAGSAGHPTQGLMQWNRQDAKSQLEKELKEGRLSPAEKSKLAEYGITFDSKGKTRAITNADQLKPELNILIGSIVLGQLVDTDWGTDKGTLRLDRVISVYNAGMYGDTGKKAIYGGHKTPALLAADVNKISSAYIKKIMGKNGALDVAVTELKGQIA